MDLETSGRLKCICTKKISSLKCKCKKSCFLSQRKILRLRFFYRDFVLNKQVHVSEVKLIQSIYLPPHLDFDAFRRQFSSTLASPSLQTNSFRRFSVVLLPPHGLVFPLSAFQMKYVSASTTRHGLICASGSEGLNEALKWRVIIRRGRRATRLSWPLVSSCSPPAAAPPLQGL